VRNTRPPLRQTQRQIAVGFQPFAISAASEGDSRVIRIEGELDLADCPRLERALEEAEASDAARIVLDLEKLTFIDVAGLHSLLNASRRSPSNGGRLRMTRASREVEQIFRLTALDISLLFVAGDCAQIGSA
jgi:anti-sigma B factor antagonist